MTRRRRRRGCRRPQGTPRGSSVVSRPRRWSRRRWGIRAPEPGARPSRSSTSSPPSARPPREPCRPTATRATVRGGCRWSRLNDDRRDDAVGSIGTHAGGGRSAGVEALMSKSEGSNLMRQVDVQESEGASAHLDRGRFTLHRRRGEHRDYAYEPQTARRGRRRAHLSPRRIDQVSDASHLPEPSALRGKTRSSCKFPCWLAARSSKKVIRAKLNPRSRVRPPKRDLFTLLTCKLPKCSVFIGRWISHPYPPIRAFPLCSVLFGEAIKARASRFGRSFSAPDTARYGTHLTSSHGLLHLCRPCPRCPRCGHQVRHRASHPAPVPRHKMMCSHGFFPKPAGGVYR